MIYIYYYLGVCVGVLIFATNNGWLVGVDINTGRELWVLKGIHEAQPEPSEKNKHFGFGGQSLVYYGLFKKFIRF